MEKKFNYVYVTTNLINGKQYIGDHSTDNLNDAYIGSGKYFQNAINHYKKENFKKEILEQFETKKEASNAQEKWIKYYNTHISQGGYNISWKGGHQYINSISDETKQKMSLAKKGKKLSLIHIENRTKSQKGKKRTKDTCNNISNSLKDRKLSEEHREKLKKPKSEETKQKISNTQKGRIPWNKGISSSEESKQKNRISHLGHIVSEETKQKISKNNAHNSPWKGKKMSEEMKLKMSISRKGKKRGKYKINH